MAYFEHPAEEPHERRFLVPLEEEPLGEEDAPEEALSYAEDVPEGGEVPWGGDGLDVEDEDDFAADDAWRAGPSVRYEDEVRRERFRLFANLSDLAAVLVGAAAILALVALIVTLVNWVQKDFSQSLSMVSGWW